MASEKTLRKRGRPRTRKNAFRSTASISAALGDNSGSGVLLAQTSHADALAKGRATSAAANDTSMSASSNIVESPIESTQSFLGYVQQPELVFTEKAMTWLNEADGSLDAADGSDANLDDTDVLTNEASEEVDVSKSQSEPVSALKDLASLDAANRAKGATSGTYVSNTKINLDTADATPSPPEPVLVGEAFDYKAAYMEMKKKRVWGCEAAGGWTFSYASEQLWEEYGSKWTEMDEVWWQSIKSFCGHQ